ncbi:hypothetical protein K438DRAFT_1784075 [Mycena galopus ATCC 62051]|nr:hypothetical protein K438DRAFT_1784075 [Mycena galopus ATCC 62051]
MASAEEIVQVWTGSRYFSAFSFIATVYDIVITIDDEVNTIWNNPNTRWHSKVVFVANRYLTVAILTFVSYLARQQPWIIQCEENMFIFTHLKSHKNVPAVGIVVLIRLYRLWDRRDSVARTLTAMFTVFMSTTIILGVFAAMQVQCK